MCKRNSPNRDSRAGQGPNQDKVWHLTSDRPMNLVAAVMLAAVLSILYKKSLFRSKLPTPRW